MMLRDKESTLQKEQTPQGRKKQVQFPQHSWEKGSVTEVPWAKRSIVWDEGMPGIFVLGYFPKRNGKQVREMSRVVKCQVCV